MNMTNGRAIKTLKAHLALNVRDVTKSIDFYQKMLGLQPSKVRTGYAKFDISEPPLNLTLNENAVTGGGALSHLGIQVASSDEVVAMKTLWEEKGLIPREEMHTTCCYALQDKAWVQDPDGNEWEVFTVLEDDLSEEVQNAAEKECCVPTLVDIEGNKQNVTTACC